MALQPAEILEMVTGNPTATSGQTNKNLPSRGMHMVGLTGAWPPPIIGGGHRAPPAPGPRGELTTALALGLWHRMCPSPV